MASSVGGGLLNLLGFKDPRAAILQGGMPRPGQPGHTPGGAAPAAGMDPAPQPPQPVAYTSPPELLSLYNDLLNRSERENRINNGIGLIASSFAQPGNRDNIMASMGGGTESPSDTLNFLMQMQEMQRAEAQRALDAKENERKLGMLPSLSTEYGISADTARLLFDNGQLDDFVMEAKKPDVEIKEAQDGTLLSINKKTGEVKTMAPGFGPTERTQNYEADMRDREARGLPRIPMDQWFTADANRKTPDPTPEMRNYEADMADRAARGLPRVPMAQWLKEQANLKEPDPTTDMRNYEADMADRAARGEPRISVDEWLTLDANRRRPVTNVNVGNSPMGQADVEMMKLSDKSNMEAFEAARGAVDTMATIQDARRQMNADGGVVVGDITAPARLEIRKTFATLFGFDDAAASNTDAFQAQMKKIVLPLVKQLGTGNSISNADREYVEKMVGSGTLTEPALRRIMDIYERGQRREISKANSRMQARVDAAGDDSPLKKTFVPIQVPDLSPEYVQSTLSVVDEQDLDQLISNADDPEARAEFDKTYASVGLTSRDVIEAATGEDPGPLRSNPVRRNNG